MPIRYSTEDLITADQYIDLLHRADFAQRRPVDDRECIAGCCYVSDLAVDGECQKQGIGRELIRHTRTRLGPRTTMMLLAAPAAREYYPKIGFETHPSAWVLGPGKELE
jgi:ribosomal protein S18 acetylase RimI-like enzyme